MRAAWGFVKQCFLGGSAQWKYPANASELLRDAIRWNDAQSAG